MSRIKFIFCDFAPFIMQDVISKNANNQLHADLAEMLRSHEANIDLVNNVTSRDP